MSVSVSHSVATRAEQLIVDLAWAQWGALTPLASRSATPAKAMLDPEALMLLSIVGDRHERRLCDVAAAWLADGIKLISVQRARTIASRLPQQFSYAFGTLAAMATAAGDHRWKRHVTSVGTERSDRVRDKESGPTRLDTPPALVLRLRAGFGVGAKSDLLAMLVGLEQVVSLRSLADGLQYGTRPLRAALDDMVLAGFVERVHHTPPMYRVHRVQWLRFLDGRHDQPSTAAEHVPRWMPWTDALVLLTHVLAWHDEATAAHWTAYVATSRLRDVVERHFTPWLGSTLHVPKPAADEPTEQPALERLIEGIDMRLRESW